MHPIQTETDLAAVFVLPTFVSGEIVCGQYKPNGLGYRFRFSYLDLMAGLYIHIPFCYSRCIYCDFYSNTDMSRRSAYLDALQQELSLRIGELNGDTISTLYIGGGTPSQLSGEELTRLFGFLSRYIDWNACEEITFEANPDDLSEEYVELLASLPIDRISMGVQSFDDRDLKFLHRRHSAQTATDAVNRCRTAGFERISIDLIYGLPHQSADDWQRNIDRAIALDLPHISAYNLIFEEGTALWRMREAGKVTECDDDLALTMYARLIDSLTAAGYEHYEISNFARHGAYARHNTSYWKGIPYLGIGAAAHSFDGATRRYNPHDLDNYIRQLLSGRTVYEEERESTDERYNDRILTSLRTMWGLDLDLLEHDFGTEYLNFCLRQATPYLHSGKLLRNGSTLRLSRSGLFVSDGIMSDLFRVDD